MCALVLLAIAGSPACRNRSASTDTSSKAEAEYSPPHFARQTATSASASSRAPAAVKWLAKVGDIVKDPKAQKPTKTERDAANHSVTYSFGVEGLASVEVEVFDVDRRRWDLMIAGAPVTPEALSAGAVTIICKKKNTVWYRFDDGPLKGSFAIPQLADPGAPPLILVSSREAMEAEKLRAESTGLLQKTSSIEEYLRIGC